MDSDKTDKESDNRANSGISMGSGHSSSVNTDGQKAKDTKKKDEKKEDKKEASKKNWLK